MGWCLTFHQKLRSYEDRVAALKESHPTDWRSQGSNSREVQFCFMWFSTSHQQSFSYVGTDLPGLNQYYARIKCVLLKDTTVTPVRLDLRPPQSGVKHSTTEPLHSLSSPVSTLLLTEFCTESTGEMPL